MDQLQQAIASEKGKRKKQVKPEMPVEGKSEGMDMEAMKNFMEGEGQLPSQEAESGVKFIWDVDSEIEPQEVSFSVNGQEMTDPAEIKEWVNANIVDGTEEETERAESVMEDEDED